jgi:hypothetical protein
VCHRVFFEVPIVLADAQVADFTDVRLLKSPFDHVQQDQTRVGLLSQR